MPGVKVKAAFIGTVIVVGYMFISAVPNNEAHAATCPALPEVAWWQTSHEKIVRHVEHHYSGKWDPYIEKWRTYREKMKSILDKNGTAIVESKGVSLNGISLENHIGNVDKRISITRCLKRKYGGRLASISYMSAKNFGFSGTGVAVVFEVAKRQAMYLAQLSNYASTKLDMKNNSK